MRQIREDTRSRFPNWNDGIMTEPSLIQMIRIDAVNSRYVRCHIVDRLADEIESQPLFRLTFVEVNLFNKFEHYWKVRSFTFKVWYRLVWYMLVYLLVLSTNVSDRVWLLLNSFYTFCIQKRKCLYEHKQKIKM